MTFRTIREPELDKVQYGFQRGGFALYGSFDFKLTLTPEIEGIEIVLGVDPSSYAQQWFGSIKTGIEVAYRTRQNHGEI